MPVIAAPLALVVPNYRRAAKSLSVCGVIAGEPRLAKLLVGLGVTDLSVAVGMAPLIRTDLGSVGVAEWRQIAMACLEAETVDEVHRLLPR